MCFTHVEEDVPFLRGNLETGYTPEDNLEREVLKNNLESKIMEASFHFSPFNILWFPCLPFPRFESRLLTV